MYRLMTPGPTQVKSQVMEARALPFRNPDLDEDFVEEYHDLCRKISKLLNTENETFILGGEGILGLEAACASLIEPGDRALVIDNGIFGHGFADFVEMYGGQPVFYTSDYRHAVDVDQLESYLKDNHDYKVATIVHGDTPSGVLNDVNAISALLKGYGIITIVDAVSTLFAEELALDCVDILCGGSQKVISAPPGLTINIVSQQAKDAINNRKYPIASFYANLKVFFNYYEEKWFPYTMPVSDINGLSVAIDNIEKDSDIIKRHEEIAEATRRAVIDSGLSLYLKNGYSNTVTVIEVPKETTAKAILDTMRHDHNIMIAGSFDCLAGKVIRIGHMGNNSNVEDVKITLFALTDTLKKLGVSLCGNLGEEFEKNIISV